MIHHVSIPAREPRHVAEVLAELMGGKCYPFGPLEGAFMAASGDEHGSMIEVYPDRGDPRHPATPTIRSCLARTARRRRPGRSTSSSRSRASRRRSSASARAKAGGPRRSAAACRASKPFFHVIEFWLENRLMIEVVSPAMAREYEDFLKSAQTAMMSDPESLRLMRATHIKQPA